MSIILVKFLGSTNRPSMRSINDAMDRAGDLHVINNYYNDEGFRSSYRTYEDIKI